MREIHFNLNQHIKVKLKPLGVDILQARHEELHNRIKARGGIWLGTFKLKTDEEGYTTFQAWEFIQIFGEHMGITKPEAFDINIKLIVG